MHDIVEVIKNLQTLSENTGAFKVLKDFERVFDELDIYVYKNWNEGELIVGPEVSRHWVTCKFMWEAKEMPDPKAAKILSEYGCEVEYKKDTILIPRKIKDPDDFRPGTRKGKIDAHPIWSVKVKMPKKLIQDVSVGKENKENAKMAELMRYDFNKIDAGDAAQETPNDQTQQPAS